MKYALISVSDKTNLKKLGQGLEGQNYKIISTGGTLAALESEGISVIPVEDITDFPECMDGRLKTLHPRISGGLLGIRDKEEHRRTMEEHKIPPIDILVVNLYPFKATISKPGHSLESAIENIDIGGPTMIRAGAKNHKYTAVVTDPADYDELLNRITEGRLEESYRYHLAAKAFRYTADYDAHISRYLTGISGVSFPETLTLTFEKHSDMRYGENPHQAAAFYAYSMQDNQSGRSDLSGSDIPSIAEAQILHGKALSYNNIADAQAALALVQEFKGQIACVAIKHATPCGAAVKKSALEAYNAVYECDPVSIFGGIVAFNCPVDEPCAKKMQEIFLEVIIAPSYTDQAMEVLTKKKDLRLLSLSDLGKSDLGNSEGSKSGSASGSGSGSGNSVNKTFEFKSVGKGLLIQGADDNNIDQEDQKIVTNIKPTPETLSDLIFAMKVAKHVKSNAIVVAKNGQLLGQGGGQVSRIWATQNALTRAGEGAKNAVVASDALIPFPDVIDACAEAGIIAVIQPGGSNNDQAAIDTCNSHNITMVLTGIRHFKH